MRPQRLEVAGFTAFRDQTVLEFDDAQFFAFVGPTGSGKSSLIDAMTFALYGKVPRLDPRMVWPVVSQGQLEARVRLDFSVGEETFTAVRVVRKTGPAAGSTKEARLERGGEVIAGDADGVSAAVEALLGLSFDQFTTCVVLPQGEFARFMQEKPAARQDLLVNLLGLKLYGDMAQRANARAAAAAAEAGLISRRLEEDLAHITAEALTRARARLGVLTEVEASIAADEARLEELRAEMRSAREQEQQIVRRIDQLSALVIPPDVDALADELAGAVAAADAAERSRAAAEESLRAAEKAMSELPPRAPLDQASEAHRQRAVLSRAVAAAETAAPQRQSSAEDARSLRTGAAAAVKDAEAAVEAARIRHAAHDLAQTLTAGAPCPVCAQTVYTLPQRESPADLTAAEASVADARRALAQAEGAQAAAQTELTRATTELEGLRAQVAALDLRFADHPDPAVLQRALDEIEAAAVALDAARLVEQGARASAQAAQKRAAATTARIKDSWRALDAARDPISDLGPPSPDRVDLGADWRALTGWAADHLSVMRADAQAASAQRAAAETAGRNLVGGQRELLREAGIEVDDATQPRDACLRALERATAQVTQIEVGLEEVERMRSAALEATERERVAKALGTALKSNAFERWVLEETLGALEEGATQVLLELSGGQYSLGRDKTGNFTVIDHRNADQVRLARTLSGGETFLASLALALALGERVAQMSANSSVRLESIFLDEGFGTLDPETLDVVAATIEGLAHGTRMVGVVTHVRDLAARADVRFEITKGITTSSVEKVHA